MIRSFEILLIFALDMQSFAKDSVCYLKRKNVFFITNIINFLAYEIYKTTGFGCTLARRS